MAELQIIQSGWKAGKKSIKEDPRPGWTSVLTNNNNINKVHTTIHKDRYLIIQQIAEEVSFSIGSCHTILNKKSSTYIISLKILSVLTNNEQKENCVNMNC